jgi:hypothetical protein
MMAPQVVLSTGGVNFQFHCLACNFANFQSFSDIIRSASSSEAGEAIDILFK